MTCENCRNCKKRIRQYKVILWCRVYRQIAKAPCADWKAHD